MSENSALSELVKKLEQSKKQELDQIKQIEAESMSELAQSLRTSLKTELSSIKDDMHKSLNTLQENMTKARQKILQNEIQTLKILQANRVEIENEAESLMQSLNKTKIRHWLVPLIVTLAIMLGLVIGMWAMGEAISGRIQTLTKLNESITKTREVKKALKSYNPILKMWNNGIELKNGYGARIEKTEEGTYFLLVEEK